MADTVLTSIFGHDNPYQGKGFGAFTAQDWANTKEFDPFSYEQIKQYDPAWKEEQRLAAEAAAKATTQGQIGAAQGSNPVGVYSGPTAEAKLQSVLPPGFENTLIPSSAADPYVNTAFTGARGKAQEFISNMLSRGTTTDTGASAGLSALDKQDPGVRSRLSDLSTALLAGGRANLRGIANEGYGAAAGQSGETFDPSPWASRASSTASQFLRDFPGSYTKSVGEAGDLYNTGGLSSAAGAAQGSRNISIDPYAQEGGRLSTGLGDSSSGAPPPSDKKRRTSIF
jgi:hypothetical protein